MPIIDNYNCTPIKDNQKTMYVCEHIIHHTRKCIDANDCTKDENGNAVCDIENMPSVIKNCSPSCLQKHLLKIKSNTNDDLKPANEHTLFDTHMSLKNKNVVYKCLT